MEQPVTISREPTLVLVTLAGHIDDQQSEVWRARLTDEVDMRGYPRFVVFDMFRADMHSSMASRFEVAKYCRAMMKRVEWAVLLVPRSVGSTLVVRLVMRLVDITNVSVASTYAELDELLAILRRGERPWR